jgi:hypothetical protein
MQCRVRAGRGALVFLPTASVDVGLPSRHGHTHTCRETRERRECMRRVMSVCSMKWERRAPLS